VAPPVEGGVAAVRTVYDGIKRAFDVVLCLVILPLVAPVAGIIAIMVRLDSTGPVIFRQTRIGRDGQPFQILKFRTLRADHDQQQDRAYMEAFIQGRTSEVGIEGEHVVNKPIDPVAVTRVGRVLRRTSLDELPQIVNVLNGEMSLVGPRPNVPWEVDAYLDWHRERLAAMPGITGLAQVRGRSCVTFDTIAAADIEYVRTRSPWLDAKILWQTVICIFTGDGAG
jgi:lipopolysaccharide/colanic/teichoic acid biosynthesis glycosyltransferase